MAGGNPVNALADLIREIWRESWQFILIAAIGIGIWVLK
jgi:hypothetical protein